MNNKSNWNDFISTCNGVQIIQGKNSYFKKLNMFGNKILIYWIKSGRISTRQGWDNTKNL